MGTQVFGVRKEKVLFRQNIDSCIYLDDGLLQQRLRNVGSNRSELMCASFPYSVHWILRQLSEPFNVKLFCETLTQQTRSFTYHFDPCYTHDVTACV